MLGQGSDLSASVAAITGALARPLQPALGDSAAFSVGACQPSNVHITLLFFRTVVGTQAPRTAWHRGVFQGWQRLYCSVVRAMHHNFKIDVRDLHSTSRRTHVCRLCTACAAERRHRPDLQQEAMHVYLTCLLCVCRLCAARTAESGAGSGGAGHSQPAGGHCRQVSGGRVFTSADEPAAGGRQIIAAAPGRHPGLSCLPAPPLR